MNIIKSAILCGLLSINTLVTVHSASAEIIVDHVNVDDYGFEKVDKSVEQQRLIDKFSRDKSQMDKAITNTKSLIQKSQGKVYLPELYVRLAELYIEKSRIVYFLRRTQSGATIKSAMESLESNALKIQAIETYQRIINQYPSFIDMDKVHFYLAHEFRELNRLKEMRGQYLTLIKKYKKSELVAESHLLLADYYTDIKKLGAAKKHLKAVLKYPKSSALGIAQYKLAWVHISKKEYKQALHLLEKSIQGPNAGKEVDIDSYGRVDIRSEAFNDMAFIYSNHYKEATPQEALAYFKKYSWSRQSYILVLEKLAYRYLVKKKWSHAGLIYRQLATLNHQPNKLLEYVDNIYRVVKELKSFEHAHEDVKVIVKALSSIKYSIHVSQDVKQKALEDYEIFARDMTTRLHQRAKKSNSVKHFELSSDAYQIYLGFFKENIYFDKMQSNYAQALFNAKRFALAGNVFERLALNSEQAKDKKRHLYSATLSFYEALKDRESLNYYETVQSQSGLAQTGERYVSSYPNSKEVPNVLFNIAWIRYDEGKFDESIAKFSDFIKTYPNSKSTKAAVKLIVDAYTIKEDYPGLIEFGKTVAANKQLSKAIRSGVASIASTAQTKMVSSMTVASIDDWENGKEKLMEFAQKHQSSSMGAQALNALFISSKEKNDLKTMQMTGQNIISSYPGSKDADSVLKTMIKASIATSQYRVLASNFELYAKQFPKTVTTKQFLMQAANIRQAMNQPELANRHYRTLLAQFKLPQNERLALTVLLANNERQQGNARGAIQAFNKQINNFSSHNLTEVHARLAVLYSEIGQENRANQHFNIALKGFNDGQGTDNLVIQEKLSEHIYQQAAVSLSKFNDTQLQDVLNQEVVMQKTEGFTQLQSSYFSLLDLGNAKWSLLASYRLYEIHNEYAAFLGDAPLPDMSAPEQTQYKEIIGKKVAEYRTQAQEYLVAGQQLAERLKSFDPLMTDYETSISQTEQYVVPFAQKEIDNKITIEAFDDAELRTLHNRMSHDPKDLATLMALAQAYYQRGDTGQAFVIAQSVSDNPQAPIDVQAQAFSLQGQVAIERGFDQLARELLQDSLVKEPSVESVKSQLANLLNHYGYVE